MATLSKKSTAADLLKKPSNEDPVEELRKLLFGPLQDRFDKLQQWVKMIEDKELQAEEVCQVLPEAIMIRASRDNQLVKAMESVTEKAIESSIRRDPSVLVSMLVPIMLPAIRKAISTLIKEMIQTLTATLEHGFSLRGLKWRYEAFKTKKSFGEIALLNSLVYQVEQVFLIHKNTGLVLLTEVSKDTILVQDPDMVSSMLTAIQDFARDSFGATQEEGLENLQFGDRSIWIEQTSLIILAAVVWGNAPIELRNILRESANAIHFEHLDKLKDFDGDIAPFESAKNHVQACLKSQFKEQRRNPFVLWTFVIIILCVIGYGSFFPIRDHFRWKTYMQKLESEPGIMVAETTKRKGIRYVFGLRDPASADPVELLKQCKLSPEKFRFKWELYPSSHPDFMIRRIKKSLNSPETISFQLQDGVLQASGIAPLQWIIDSKVLAESIPGIIRYTTDAVIPYEQKQIETLKTQIENTFFYFDAVSTKIKPTQEEQALRLASAIKEIFEAAQTLGKEIQIEIIGHTDSVGTVERNLEISQKRADEIFSFLVSKGIKPERLSKKGVGSSEPFREELNEKDREFNRCVNLKVMIREK